VLAPVLEVAAAEAVRAEVEAAAVAVRAAVVPVPVPVPVPQDPRAVQRPEGLLRVAALPPAVRVAQGAVPPEALRARQLPPRALAWQTE
jgi:hypothetical protein